jgi:signal transduction histidine kinase
MMTLAQRAAALGRGEPVTAIETDLREANQVGAELAMASESLREREADLREANEESQRFAYIVSHDLRSPLVNIMGFTTELEALRQDVFGRLHAARYGEPRGPLLALGGSTAVADRSAGEEARDEELGHDFDEAIGFIKTSIAKMDRLINAILRLSREGRREFKPERIDMDALAGSIRDSLAHQAAAAEAEVIVGELPDLVSDRLALEQIFSNLADNALKYLRRGVPGRVEIEGRATAAGLVYEVRDNGRGIDPKDRERVFDLFRRSGAQDRPGEGIGLAHVRALVRRLGGTITLTSEPGQGSTFTVTLPRRWRGERKRKAA